MKYIILADYIRKNIMDSTFPPGSKLKSENQLSAEFSVSRQTVRQAIALLINEGYLESRQGSGTFVVSTTAASKAKTVGLIATEITEYIFPSIISGIEDVVRNHGYSLALGVTKNKVAEENRLIKKFLDDGVSGLIIEGCKTALPNPNVDLFRELEKANIPYVFINGYYQNLNSSYVVTEDYNGGVEATDYLIQCGCKNIGGIFKADDMQGLYRYNGYVNSLIHKYGNDFKEKAIWYTTDTVDLVLQSQFILKSFSGCDGILCYNDQIAIKIIQILLSNGISVPENIQIVSFDNSYLSELSPIKITSMNHPKEELGRAAAELLVTKMTRHKKDVSINLPFQLVVKNSTDCSSYEKSIVV